VIVQWCIKGMSLQDDTVARRIIDAREGLVCRWWRENGQISPADTAHKLSLRNLDMHVNHFTETDPTTKQPFERGSPFISLSAGTVERDVAAQTNHVHRARRTALYFGTDFGRLTSAYLYYCWVVLAPRAAVEIEYLAEEVRDLNAYRHYSPFQTEGEVVAKIVIGDSHIQRCEKWELRAGPAPWYQRTWTHSNPRFVNPERLTNVREVI
jgi:hypothetical protein